MQLKRWQGNPVLVANVKNKWEAGAVFNCSVVHENNSFHLLYRAVASGFSPLPSGGYKNYISSIGYAKSKDGLHFERRKYPIIKPQYQWERFGCEDPRVTKLNDTYYIFYTALSEPAYSTTERGIRIALATTKDFKKIRKYGVVGPNITSKAATLFPEKIQGKVSMVFTWRSDSPDSSIAYVTFENESQVIRPPKGYWEKISADIKKHLILQAPKSCLRGPEVGAPPIKTKKGWLLIYCGAAQKRIWSISAALLDIKNPQCLIAKSRGPILEPEKPYELRGLVANVAFPSGAVIRGNKLFVYYGAADKTCCLATCNLNQLLKSLKPVSR